MNDIQTSEDVSLLVDRFYEKVQVNPKIGFIFNDVAHVDWAHHLPKMYSFWRSLLFGEAAYKGNPMLQHVLLNKKIKLIPEHFEEWKRLFNETVHENFQGAVAEQAIKKAANIASLMLYKVQQSDSPLHIQ